MQRLLALALTAGILATFPANASSQLDLPYGGQTVLARGDDGRTLYDRNKALRDYQRQRGEASRFYCDEQGNVYYYEPSQDLTYWAPGYHPDAAGNEDR